MFVGPCHFNDFERVCIWNSQPFSASVYGETDENWCIESEKNFWVKLLPRQKLKIAEKIVQPLKKVEKEFKKVFKTEKINGFDEKFEKIGFRELLWVSLSIDENWKLKLFLNNFDDVEAEIIGFLLLAERKQNVFFIENADFVLEDCLDAKIYDKVFQSCFFLAEINRTRIILDEINSLFRDIDSLHDYKLKINHEVADRKKLQEKMNKEYNKRTE